MKIIDLHCDTLYKFSKYDNYLFTENDGHISENGLAEGDYMVQCFAIYVPAEIRKEEAYSYFYKQLEQYKHITGNSKLLKCANSKDDIQKNSENGMVSSVLTVENADLLNGKIERLYELRECGVRILGLIHNGENCLGFPHTDTNNPLKRFGREVVEALNSTDITVDVAHLNYKGFCDVAELSKKPFISTHSACDSLCHHTRNLSDEQIRKIANSGGIVGLAFYSEFLNGTSKTHMEDIINHLDHLIKLGGQDVAALGTDFDGMSCDLFLNNCSEMSFLTDALIKKFGFNLAEKICYKNALRIF